LTPHGLRVKFAVSVRPFIKPILFLATIALTAVLGFGLKEFQPEINTFFGIHNVLERVFVH
jgi:hypothetical protein